MFTLKASASKVSKTDYFFKILFIYSQEAQKERQGHRQMEKQAPYGEPDAELDPRTSGPRPEPKADTQPLSHAGIPGLVFE